MAPVNATIEKAELEKMSKAGISVVPFKQSPLVSGR